MFNPLRFESQKIEQRHNLEDKNLEQMIKSFNYDILKDIVGDYLLKCGIEKSRMDLLSAEIIAVVKQPNFIKRIFERVNGKQTLAEAFFPEKKIEVREDILNLVKVDHVLLSLIHEMVHVISHVKENKNRKDFTWVEEIGVSSYTAKLGFVKVKNEVLNEGLTQLFAEAVKDEYLRRIPVSGKSEDLSIPVQLHYTGNYGVAKEVVQLLCRSISKKTNIPDDIIFFALMRSMFTGDYFDFEKEIESDDELKFLVSRIKELKSEEDISTRTSTNTTIDFDRLLPEGNIFSDTVNTIAQDRNYYNPLVSKLG